MLTDNGTHFTSPGNVCSAAPEIRLAIERVDLFRAHSFEYACAQNNIDHRLTKSKHLADDFSAGGFPGVATDENNGE